MDDHWSFRICVQIPIILKNFGENARFLFSMKVQVTRQLNQLHESCFVHSVGTSLGKETICFSLVKSNQK